MGNFAVAEVLLLFTSLLFLVFLFLPTVGAFSFVGVPAEAGILSVFNIRSVVGCAASDRSSNDNPNYVAGIVSPAHRLTVTSVRKFPPPLCHHGICPHRINGDYHRQYFFRAVED